MFKKCITCKKEKENSLSFFYKNYKYTSGVLQTVCIDCRNNTQRSRKHLNNKGRTKREAAKRISGICLLCAKVTLNPSCAYCEKHFVKAVAFRHLGSKSKSDILMSKLIEQDYKCAYSGRVLHLGGNASIDHKKSRVNYPDLQNEEDNIHWVDIQVNLMKRELSEIDFFSIIKDIYELRVK